MLINFRHCAFDNIYILREVIAWFKEPKRSFCLRKIWMREQIILHRMLEVKCNNDFLIKETHQIHSEAGKVTTSSWIDDVVVDTRFFIPYLNFSGFENMFIYIDFSRKGGVLSLPVCPLTIQF